MTLPARGNLGTSRRPRGPLVIHPVTMGDGGSAAALRHGHYSYIMNNPTNLILAFWAAAPYRTAAYFTCLRTLRSLRAKASAPPRELYGGTEPSGPLPRFLPVACEAAQIFLASQRFLRRCVLADIAAGMPALCARALAEVVPSCCEAHQDETLVRAAGRGG